MGKCTIIIRIKGVLNLKLPCAQMDTEMKPVFTAIVLFDISLVIRQIAMNLFWLCLTFPPNHIYTSVCMH